MSAAYPRQVPEGQISHRNARDFGRTLVGHPLVHVAAPGPRLASQRIPERLTGDVPVEAAARGKHHLLRFESGRLLVSHLMMSGVWRLRPAGDPPWGRPDLVLATERHQALLYRCPNVRLLEPGEPLPREVAVVGPDLLDPEVDPAAATVTALGRADPTRQVGDALMDQRLVAGIGNVYKSETCFLAGIDPWRAVGTLSEEERARLGEIGSRLLADGVRQNGRIGTYRRPGSPPGTITQGKWVYGRAGRPCRRCGAVVRSRGQGDANRTTYWCPGCQA